jgi:hypothetical protein
MVLAGPAHADPADVSITASAGSATVGIPFTYTVAIINNIGDIGAFAFDDFNVLSGSAAATITGLSTNMGDTCDLSFSFCGLGSGTGTWVGGSTTLVTVQVTATSPGSVTLTSTVSDGEGTTLGSATGTTTVNPPGFPFTGFFAPVDNPPTVNSMNAGRAVPVKFSLGGNQGLNIFAAGSPSSQQVDCATGAPISVIEQTVTAGNSSLQYDPATGQYTYVWKTDKVWGGTCRTLTLQLTDGTTHTAGFTFH